MAVPFYQGVTLGGTGKDKGKRHPTLGKNVLVGSGAKVLGPFTVGDGSKIARNAVVLEPIPPDCTAVGVPAGLSAAAANGWSNWIKFTSLTRSLWSFASSRWKLTGSPSGWRSWRRPAVQRGSPTARRERSDPLHPFP